MIRCPLPLPNMQEKCDGSALRDAHPGEKMCGTTQHDDIQVALHAGKELGTALCSAPASAPLHLIGNHLGDTHTNMVCSYKPISVMRESRRESFLTSNISN